MSTADVQSDDSHLVCGKIAGVYGVRGWVKVRSYTHPDDALLNYKPWFVKTDNGFSEIVINDMRVHGKGLVAQLNSIDDRDVARSLVGKEVWVRRESLPSAADDEYYWHDLENCQVLDSEQHLIGKVSYMLDAGAHDVMVIKGKDSETLIPFDLESVVKEVDLQKHQIVVDWDWS